MHHVLAYAEQQDLSGSQWTMVLLFGAVVVGVGVLAVVLIGMARSRGHRQADVITAAALLWVLGAGVSGIRTVMARVQWTKEYNQLIESGYFDPRDKSGAPQWPWVLWGVLGVVYVALVLYARSQGNAPPERGETPGPPTGKSDGQADD